MSANDDSYWQPYAPPVQPEPAATIPSEYGNQEAVGSAEALPTPPDPPIPLSGRAAPRRNRKRWTVVTAVVAGTVLLGGGSAYAADNHQASKICSAMKDADAASGKSNDGATDYVELRSTLKSTSRMLFFSNDLKGAIVGLLQDLDRFEALKAEEDRSGMSVTLLGEAFTLMGSMNSHVRTAQQACNLPATGIPNLDPTDAATNKVAAAKPAAASIDTAAVEPSPSVAPEQTAPAPIPRTTAAPKPEPTKKTPKVHKGGTRATATRPGEDDKFYVTVATMRSGVRPSEWDEPRKGQFVSVQLTVRGVSGTADLSSQDIGLVTSDGTVYDAAFTMADDGLPYRELGPGQKLTGKVYFDVPVSAQRHAKIILKKNAYSNIAAITWQF